MKAKKHSFAQALRALRVDAERSAKMEQDAVKDACPVV